MRARSERQSQDRLAAFLTRATAQGGLGYRHLGDWSKGTRSKGIEVDILRANLATRGYSPAQIAAAQLKLETACEVTGTTLYNAGLRAYGLLRYGVDVQTEVGQPHQTVHLVDWANPAANDFALAEEVTLKGGYERRPDVVLYLNGIAISVIELKRAAVEVGDGIRQLITNQEPIFNAAFFPTVQLALAGSDAQGLRYGTVGTPETHFMTWKDEVPPETLAPGDLLDRPVGQMLEPTRLLDLIRNFVIFDAGQKKVPRQHQFIGVKKAQDRIAKREGGVIWHTQGSGKSILMVLIAKWLMEHDPAARILIVTDRDELDKQIAGVMRNAGVIAADAPSPRVINRDQFVAWLTAPAPRLMCALLHKFDSTDLSGPAPKVHGRFYVFVDECHRTQGGDMNKQMKRWLEGAIFIGFTGTPLLRKDRQMTRDVFGTYIHTYKFQEAVADKVVLDLKYEARDVPQRLTNQAVIDAWFDQKTKGLNNFQKAVLRKRWATMEDLMSAEERKARIVAEIIQDFSLKPRLNNNRGTAILVAASIYDACHYMRLFRNKSFGDHVGLITSYEPNHNAISREPANSDERFKYDTYTRHVLVGGQTTKDYEDEAKRQFIDEPARMKLLIVVSKLLTGFDAPSCSYIYLDNEQLHDHNLFQAICRTNRLDGDDKDYGYIVDFKELFGDVQQAIAVYSSDELDIDAGGSDDDNPTIKNWLEEGRKQLDQAYEALAYLCEPVVAPKGLEEFLTYFCGSAPTAETLEETEALRITFYKCVATFVRAFSAVAQHLDDAGYSSAQQAQLQQDVAFYGDARAAIKKHSGEELDIKPFEADMRHLLNTYVQADPAQNIGNLGQMSLTEAIIETGIHDAIAQKLNDKGKLSKKSIAEGIINNLRRTIIRDQLTDPRFYDQMSKLLEDLIRQSRDDAAAYEQFLLDAQKLAQQLGNAGASSAVPADLKGNREAIVLFNNLDGLGGNIFACPADEEGKTALAMAIDQAIRGSAQSGWKGDYTRERQVKSLIYPMLNSDPIATLALFEIVKSQQGY
ncbi:type I restriction endonuclease subunit R [Yoonia sp. MH D7]